MSAPMTPERFVLRTKQVGDCWEWQGERVRGYGRTWRTGERILAHRYSYETFVGPIPPGLEIDHLCRNRACVLPAHLEAVTRQENIRRTRRATCKNGHTRKERLDGTRLDCAACRRKPTPPPRYCKDSECSNQLFANNHSGWCTRHAWRAQEERKRLGIPPTFNSPRTTQLKPLGINPDDYSESTPGRRTVTVTSAIEAEPATDRVAS